MDDCRKRQTSTATPAEPGDLPWGLAMQLTSGPHIRTSINIEYFRINADRWIDGSDRSIELLVAMQDEAAIEVGGGNARIELHGLIEIGNRPIIAALLVPDYAPGACQNCV